MHHFDLLNVALGVLLLGGLVAVVTRPVNAVYAYLVVLFFFPTVNWGVATGVESMNLYSRGTGLFYFSFVNLYLYGLFVLGAYYWGRQNPGIAACNLRKYFVFFLVLFLVQTLVGTMAGVPLERILMQRGTINTVNVGLVTILLIRAVNTPHEVRRLANIILIGGAVRGTYGMMRFLFWGGDVANVYNNIQKVGIKLTFFDINDGLLACLAAFIAAWRFFDRGTPARHKPLYAAITVLEVLIVAFSYRRTGWFGLALASVLFCFMQPLRLRITLLLTGMVGGGLGLTMLIARRFSKLSHGRGAADMLFYDVKGSVKEGRFAELYQAFQTVVDHALFGVGPWGGYGPAHREFMHSGFLHLWLKSGLVGLLPFIGMLLAFGYFWLRRKQDVPWAHRDTFGAGLAGLLFLMPTFMGGTPIIEYRTMQMFGLCLALPYLTYGVCRAETKQRTATPAPAVSGFALARQKLIDGERSVARAAERRPA